MIDPVLAYSTFLGGSGDDTATAITVDSGKNAYITGSTDSVDFPTTAGYQPAKSGDYDAFITKLNAAGTAVLWSTYLGGTGHDQANGIALDPKGNVIVAGETTSTNFPVTASAFQPVHGPINPNAVQGDSDAFISKLNPTGNILMYSTYLGGTNADAAYGVAVDTAGLVYAGGFTTAADFPVNSPIQPALRGQSDGFVAKFDTTKAGATSRIYSTYLGGNQYDFVNGIAADANGNAYAAGQTQANPQSPGTSPNFPTTAGSFQPTYKGSTASYTPAGDGFISKINPSGTAFVYSTYLGGHDRAIDPTLYGDESDAVEGIQVDADGYAYVVGRTSSADFPFTSGSYMEADSGKWNYFITKLTPAGNALVFSSRLKGGYQQIFPENGGLGELHSVAIDSARAVYAIGSGSPWSTAHYNCQYKASGAYCSDAHVIALNPSGSTKILDQKLGGDYEERGLGIAVDSAGAVYAAGRTTVQAATEGQNLGDFYPVIPGDYQTKPGGGSSEAFVTKILVNYGSCSVPSASTLSVHICSPTNGATVTSPFHISAAANGPNGVKRIEVWLDGVKKTEVFGDHIEYDLAAANGTHSLTLIAVEANPSVYSKTTYTITVSSSTTTSCPVTTTNSAVICLPAENSTVASPVHVTAATNATGFQSQRIYVDNNPVYTTNSKTIDTYISLGSGIHHMALVVYNGTSNPLHAFRDFSVSSGIGLCGAPATDMTINICSPAAGSTVSSPVTVSARARWDCCAISHMRVYVDNVDKYDVSYPAQGTINTQIALPTGSHNMVIIAWDNAGQYIKASRSFSVK